MLVVLQSHKTGEIVAMYRLDWRNSRRCLVYMRKCTQLLLWLLYSVRLPFPGVTWEMFQSTAVQLPSHVLISQRHD